MKVLFVDDETDILEQGKIFLEKEEDELDVDTAASPREGLEMLNDSEYDAIVSDYQMPEMDGLEFLETVRKERDSDIPFIIFTGKGREEVAMEALNLGASRYLQKGGSPKSQYGVLAEAVVQEARRNETEKKLRESEKRYKGLFESARVAIIVHGSEGEITSANPAAVEAFGLKEEELKEKSLDYWKGLLYTENREQMKISEFPVSKVLDSKQPVEEQIMGLSTEETRGLKWYIASAVPQFNEKGEIERVISSFKDITNQKRLQDRKDFLNTLLRQDLRNKYQVIHGYYELLKEESDLAEEYREYLRKSMKASREADEILGLTKKLDKIEKTEVTGEKEVVKVMEFIIDTVSDLVEREKVEIEEDYPESIGKIKGDYSLYTLFTQLLATRIRIGGSNKIKISASEREKGILVRIEDDGKQLSEDVKNLFTGSGYKADTSGVGGVRYYIIGEIARHNNAKIEVKDSELGGARFDVYLQKGGNV